jgi:5-methylthioadenosine/S-adenosylhomocysteine deaminase
VFARRSIALESFSRYLKAGVNLAIGTDTFPQDIVHDMKIASTVSKLVDRDCCTASARDVFNAATLGGAKALGRGDLGRIAPGAKADLLFFKRHTLRMSPLRDPLKNIVFNSGSEDIDRVMIDGRFVVEGGRVTGVDESELAASFQVAMERLWAEAVKHDRAGRSVDELSPLSLPAWEE